VGGKWLKGLGWGGGVGEGLVDENNSRGQICGGGGLGFCHGSQGCSKYEKDAAKGCVSS